MMNSQQAAAPSQAAARYPNLIRLESFQKFAPIISQEMRVKMYSAIQSAWAVLDNTQPGQPQHTQAHNQLLNISQKLSQAAREMNQRSAQRNAQQQGQQQSQGGATQSSASSAQSPSQMQPSTSLQQSQQGQQGSAQQQEQLSQQQLMEQQLATLLQPAQFTQSQQNFFDQFQFTHPADAPAGTERGDQWIKNVRIQFRNLLYNAVQWTNLQKDLTQKATMAQSQGSQQQAESLTRQAEIAKNKSESLMAKFKHIRTTQDQARQGQRPAQAQSSMENQQQQQQGQQQHQQRPVLNPQQPQSATGTGPSQPVPLSHSAALDAARSHSEQLRTSSQGQTPSQQAPSHNQPRPPSETTPSAQRYPIPKMLHPAAADRPLAVTGAPQRPSLAAAGSMGQPVIPKTTGFVLEGDGSSRVLSKKKLNEIVRQVTGGTDALGPEVEEVIYSTL
jgi:hypothetical protein